MDGPRVAVEVEAVGRDAAGHHAVAEAPRRLDQHPPALRVERVAREQDAGDLSRDEPLDDDGHRQPVVADALVLAVGDGAFGVERGPAAADGVADLLVALDAEEGLLLAGEAGDGAVLGRGGGADGDRPAAEAAVGVGDVPAEFMAVGEGWPRQRRKAALVTQKPGGTGRPAEAMRPRLRPLPPTASMSEAVISSKVRSSVMRCSLSRISRKGARGSFRLCVFA